MFFDKEFLKKWLTFRPWERHSTVVFVGGLVYICLGVSYLAVSELSVRRSISLFVALSIMPLETWASLFIIAGLLACISSTWPSFSDIWGYMVLTGLSAGWSAMYFTGFIFGPASVANLPYALIWFLMAFTWWGISGLVNPTRDPDLEEVVDGMG